MIISEVEFRGCGISADNVTQIDIVNSTFKGNEVSGTTLRVNNSNVMITKCAFASSVIGSSHNRATTDFEILYSDQSLKREYVVGGAIISSGASNITINESMFEANRADLGGAIFAEQNSKVRISHSIINGAGSYSEITSGAAIYADSGCAVVLINSVISDFSAMKSGGAIFLYNSTLTAHQCTFLNNSSPLGGSMFGYMSTISLSGCKVGRNTASKQRCAEHHPWCGYGGAIHAELSTLLLERSQFFNNVAQQDGGAVQIYNGTIILERCNFSGNRADQSGGAISVSYSDLIVSKCSFYNSSTGDVGGAMFIIGHRKEITTAAYNTANDLTTKGTFFNNNATNYYGDALYSEKITVIIRESTFFVNSAVHNGGALLLEQVHARVYDSHFKHNKAYYGGGIYSRLNSTVTIEKSTFISNNATIDTGALLGDQSLVRVNACKFSNNSAKWAGAVAAYEGATITMKACTFTYNRAKWGGALALHMGTLIINKTIFEHQEVTKQGGVVYVNKGQFIMEESSVRYNKAGQDGGALIGVNARLSIIGCNFSHNDARVSGSAIHLSQCFMTTYGCLVLELNTAQMALIYLYDSTVNFTGSVTSEVNTGSIYAYDSHVTFRGLTIVRNSSSDSTKSESSITNKSEINKFEGGAITAIFGSIINFRGRLEITNNHAPTGGGFLVTESQVYFNADALIANNGAAHTGGALYIYQGELNCKLKCNLQIRNNSAAKRGGGIHALSSLIKVTSPSSTINFIDNKAGMGGGICFEMNAKLYILQTEGNSSKAISFTANEAVTKGGAIFVVDGPHACSNRNKLLSVTNECFLQTIDRKEVQPSYLITNDTFNKTSSDTVMFYNNTAESGLNIYGGLIGKCAIAQYDATNIHGYQPGPGHLHSPSTVTIVQGTSHIRKFSNLEPVTISSDPIQICVCRNGWPDCEYKPCPITILKGGSFGISVVTIDQAYQPIAATVYSFFKSAESVLTKHYFLKMNANDSGVCTNLTFTSNTPGNTPDELVLEVEGPCKGTELSRRRFEIEFYSCPKCPVGFEPLDSTRCECTCDSTLQPYITKCNSSAGTLLRKNKVWLSYYYINKSEGYLLYQFCPLDYCHPPSVNVELNLNIPGGSDAQCAFNRTGLLCGNCRPGFSLSLGSSRCLPCDENWPVNFVLITLAGLLVGIAITVTILVLNLTVAVGTINAVILYANILASSYSTFLSADHSTNSFVKQFLLFINVELAVDECYLKGMNTYIKTWLQLGMPLYMFVLVVLIIKLSQWSSRFSNLIGKRNPVATLSTLILLSFCKILSITISVLSFSVLRYPDGSRRHVWTSDATVEYLSGKHIALVVLTAVIYLFGFAYTALLFFWQWILHVQHCGILKWTRNPRMITFMETYHAPFNPTHRYWIGLLLIVRVALYLVAALNESDNPRVILLSTALTMGCLLFWKCLIVSRIYKNWVIDALETFTLLNILTLSASIWFLLDLNIDNTFMVSTSVGAMTLFLLFMAVITNRAGIKKAMIEVPFRLYHKRRVIRVQNDTIELGDGGQNNVQKVQSKQPTYSTIEPPKPKQQ